MRWSRPNSASLADRLAAGEGHPRGFDYLRLVLAFCVVGFHSFTTIHDVAADHLLWRSAWRPILRLFLPMFFALSGFLVAGSLARSASLVEFLARRVLRLMPALVAEVLLSALVLGPLLTAYPLSRYFADHAFLAYLLNAVGVVHFALPGVFLHNPRPGLVNGSLWTLPFEGICYALLTVLSLLGVVRRRGLVLALTVAASVGLAIAAARQGGVIWAPPGSFLVVCFLAGVALFQYREKIPADPRLFILASAVSLLLLAVDQLTLLAPLPLAYATVWLGLTRPPASMAVGGDYSYGVYLFAYPIQQAIVAIWPAAGSPLAVFLLAAPLSLAYAVFSWRCIERPILRRKSAIARVFRGRASAVRAAAPG